MKKLIVSLFLITIFSLILVACTPKDDSQKPPTDLNPDDKEPNIVDNNAPIFVDAVDGFLIPIEHLQHVYEDLLKDIIVTDNYSKSEDIKLIVSDFGGYNKDISGQYTITISATDESLNTSLIKRKVIVAESFSIDEAKLYLNNKVTAHSFNEVDALSYQASGTKFRSKDMIQVMSKSFFIEEFNRHKSNHINNNSIPYFPNGVIIVVDMASNIKHVRLAIGKTAEINSLNEMRTGDDLSWKVALDGVNGGGMFKDFVPRLDEFIPDDGFIIFVGTVGQELGRRLLTNTIFDSTYITGAIEYEKRNVDIRDIKINVEITKNYLPLPERLTAPQINIERHILSFKPVINAKEYIILVDQKEVLRTSQTSVELDKLDLELTPSEDAGYSIEVIAVSNDIYKWASSLKSNSLNYKKINILDLEKPVISVNENILKWNSIENATSYEVILNVLGNEKVIHHTTSTELDLNLFGSFYYGTSDIYIKAIGNDFYRDSLSSNTIEVFLGEVETFEIDGYMVDIIRTSAWNYFARRGENYTSSKKGFAASPYLFLITDAVSLLDPEFELEVTELFSTIILLESNGNTKMINSISPLKTWNLLDGWYENKEYNTNTQQIPSFMSSLYEGDMLLIGKNGNKVNVATPEKTLLTDIGARDFLAHFYIKKNLNNDFTLEAWRGELSTYLDPINVNFEIIERFEINAEKLPAPVITINEEQISWQLDTRVKNYMIFVDEVFYMYAEGEFITLENLNLTGKAEGSGPYSIYLSAVPVNQFEWAISDISNKVEYEKYSNNPDPIDPEEPHKETFDTLKIGQNQVLISFNATGILNHTPSGASFRSKEVIQVMSKTHFITEYTEAKTATGYLSNGSEVFFPNGVLLIVDKSFNVKHLRMGVGSAVEVDGNNTVKTSGLKWTNATQNATTGGGLFAGLLGNVLDEIIPDDGYIIFAPATTSNTSRTFLMKNTFESAYVSGGSNASKKDIDIRQIDLELLKNT
ncbi:hypothetical protein [Acholeplasma granularum]|uniref:hypothetical protein n=1 Tax=Acholeplasma granularum TaxID=264635 RepID=UPI0004713156|nr:hypothetical protein [Acholeplasma granularum]